MTQWLDKIAATLGWADELDDTPPDLAYAQAALLFEMADVDGTVEPAELARIQHLLQTAHKLSASEAATMLSRVRRDHDGHASFYPHASQIKAHCSQEEKAELVEQLWTIAAADGQIDGFEEKYMRTLANVIGLSPTKLIEIKHQVQSHR